MHLEVHNMFKDNKTYPESIDMDQVEEEMLWIDFKCIFSRGQHWVIMLSAFALGVK